MISEYRMLLTATFNTKSDRDEAISAMTKAVQEYSNSVPGVFKRADVSGDEYWIPDAPVSATKVV